ncbi:amidohydrolase family protein [Phenylobacterium sp.]|uniref:N-acyl-D-amino-acid deacylase family protein n=1 Tax=Phenylobacterium sp. TaxID=1871053 RepID=UPI00301BFA34
MTYDLIIRGGSIIDGTGAPRFIGDIAVKGGRIARIGKVEGRGDKELDATGLIVAPGVIDLHAHYDAQLHWDPYCTASGWHGTTTCMISNCGFGFAPVRPGMADRYMRMMENTEQVPYDAMARTMPWTWETFPEWLDHLRSLPKGVNIASYLPVNPLLSYVIGPDEAKTRPATAAERAEMRRIMHEAMDAGAAGFAFSHLGAEGNSHVDHDQSPMPSDVMAAEEAYNLADVLRERGEGVIQTLVELPGMADPPRKIVEELARRSGRPVLHNILVASGINPEQHRSVLRWLDEMAAEGLEVWSQGATFRKPLEITPMHYNNWDAIPIFRALSAAHTREEKVALVRSADYRERFEREYDAGRMWEVGGPLEVYVLMEAGPAKAFEPFIDKPLAEIAQQTGRSTPGVFLDLLEQSNMEALVLSPVAGSPDYNAVAEIVRHPRVLPGISDGGAHSKHGNGGFWSTDMILMMHRESQLFSLEELHAALSARSAQAARLRDRGTLTVGAFADIMVYDIERLNYDPPLRYEVLHDLPGGDWRKVKRAVGIRYTIVNGDVTFVDGECTGAVPGVIVDHQSRTGTLRAAE